MLSMSIRTPPCERVPHPPPGEEEAHYSDPDDAHMEDSDLPDQVRRPSPDLDEDYNDWHDRRCDSDTTMPTECISTTECPLEPVEPVEPVNDNNLQCRI